MQSQAASLWKEEAITRLQMVQTSTCRCPPLEAAADRRRGTLRSIHPQCVPNLGTGLRRLVDRPAEKDGRSNGGGWKNGRPVRAG